MPKSTRRSSRLIHSALVALVLICGDSGLVAHEGETQRPFEHPHAHGEIEGHAHVGWDSRYFTEGRDALDGDFLIVSSFELGWNHIAGGIWYGNSPDQDYDELQISLALTEVFGDLEVYAGYTHFRFPFADAHDNEVGAGLTYSGLPADLLFSLDAYYSFEADGMFAELGLNREFSLTDHLTLHCGGVFGINQGYVSDGHDGANHVALHLGLAYAITDNLSLVAHTAYSWGIDQDIAHPGDEQLIDFFHGGVGLELSF